MNAKNALLIVLMAVLVVFAGVVTGSARAYAAAEQASVMSAIRDYLTPTATVQMTGNGAPSGEHFSLNIIGVSKTKTAPMTGGDAHRIFVGLGSKNAAVSTKILLEQSTDGTFQVLDGNGTDGSASFKLPAPGTYSIWARPLGKPGGDSKITTCAIDPTTGEEVCSTSNEVFVRGTGKSSFRNVTTALTSIDLDSSLTEVIDACGATTVSLFDPCLENYFWSYDNNGLKLLQIRFYPAQ